jgi:hypothetical protein
MLMLLLEASSSRGRACSTAALSLPACCWTAWGMPALWCGNSGVLQHPACPAQPTCLQQP